MLLLRTSDRDRLTDSNRPADCPASSAGQFVIRVDGTARFDRHFHDVAEFWFVAAGLGIVEVGETCHHVQAGDIVYTPAGVDHDILAVAEELRIFWLSGPVHDGCRPGHLHRTPELTGKHPVATIGRGDGGA
jgi:mannose-6-phosphate isomerase-like protein (cupin superfamily)